MFKPVFKYDDMNILAQDAGSYNVAGGGGLGARAPDSVFQNGAGMRMAQGFICEDRQGHFLTLCRQRLTLKVYQETGPATENRPNWTYC